MENKNLPEFIALIKRYESIELPEIQAIFDKYSDYLGKNRLRQQKILTPLTGFGYPDTCKLCVAVMDFSKYFKSPKCVQCVYAPVPVDILSNGRHCNDGTNKITYDAIYNAQTPNELLKAYSERAQRMREVLKEKGININNLNNGK